MACAASCPPGRQDAWKGPWTVAGGVEIGAIGVAVGPGGGCQGCHPLETSSNHAEGTISIVRG